MYKTTSLSRKDRQLIRQSEQYKLKMKEYEEKSAKLEPVLENRIICIKNEQVKPISSYFVEYNLTVIPFKALPRLIESQKRVKSA